MRSLIERLRPALRWETGLAAVALLLIVVGSSVSPQFLTVKS